MTTIEELKQSIDELGFQLQGIGEVLDQINSGITDIAEAAHFVRVYLEEKKAWAKANRPRHVVEVELEG